MLLVIAGTGGVLMPAWMDVVAGAIPTTLRGRFFAFAGVGASLAGLGAGLITAWLLSAVPAPRSYGLCFLLCALFMAVSYAALTSVREKPVARGSVRRLDAAASCRRVPAILRGDANLAWYLAARACGSVGTMAGGFYTVYAITDPGRAARGRRVCSPPSWSRGKIVGDLTLGWVADHLGHRLVLITGVVATVAGNALALLSPSIETLGVVFALLGVHLAANNVSGLNVLLEFAPSAAERPTYIGLGLTTVAPLAFAAPLLAGLSRRRLGLSRGLRGRRPVRDGRARPLSRAGARPATPGRDAPVAADTPWDQRLARWLVRPFARTPLRPNHITTLSLALGVAAGLLFARGEARAAGWGAALFMLARFIDHADGELARLTGRTSRVGYYYDYVAGALSSVALFAGIGVGYAGGPLGGWALALGLAASVAALAATGIRARDGRAPGLRRGALSAVGALRARGRHLPHRPHHLARRPRGILRAGRPGADRLLRVPAARAPARPPVARPRHRWKAPSAREHT